MNHFSSKFLLVCIILISSNIFFPITYASDQKEEHNLNSSAKKIPQLPSEIYCEILKWLDEPQDYTSFILSSQTNSTIAKEFLNKETKRYLKDQLSFKLSGEQWRLAWTILRQPALEIQLDIDKKKSLALLNTSFEQGHLGAMTQLGLIYFIGDKLIDSENKDPVYAFNELLYPAATKGYAKAQYKVGKIFYFAEEQVVERDEKLAKEWYEKSAKQLYVPAMLALGNLLNNFNSRFRNYNEAAVWYHRAATRSLNESIKSEALTNLSRIELPEARLLAAQAYDQCTSNKSLAIHHYVEACDKGNEKALTILEEKSVLDYDYQCAYGQTLLKGTIYKSPEGITAINQAAARGSREANYILGQMYEYAKGYEEDIDKAIDYYFKSAMPSKISKGYSEAEDRLCKITKTEEQISKAQFLLGLIYYEYWELEPSNNEQKLQKSRNCFKKSAQKGNLQACEKLGIMCLKGQGGHKSPLEAETYLKQAADKNYPKAQYYLAKLYLEGGIGVRKDTRKAINLLCQDSLKSDPDALLLLGLLYLRSTDDIVKNEYKAREYFENASLYGSQRAKEEILKLDKEACAKTSSNLNNSFENFLIEKPTVSNSDIINSTINSDIFNTQEVLFLNKIIKEIRESNDLINRIKNHIENKNRNQSIDVLITKAIKEACVISQEAIGGMYYSGIGFKLDYDEAAKWFLLAIHVDNSNTIKKGKGDAEYNIANICAFNYNSELAVERANYWYEKAMLKDSKDASIALNQEYDYD